MDGEEFYDQTRRLGAAVWESLDEEMQFAWGCAAIQFTSAAEWAAAYRREAGLRSQSDLEAVRRAIARYGAPPPGEGTHPLQGHRDSMG